MSDAPPDRPPIDAAIFARFLAAKGRNRVVCPICHHSDFLLLMGDSGRTLALLDMTLSNPDISDLRAQEILSLECKSCGHQSLFRRQVVEAWLRENPA